MSVHVRRILQVLVPAAIVAVLSALMFFGTITAAFWPIAMAVVVAAVYWPIRDRLPNVLLVFASVFVLLTIAGAPAPTLYTAGSDVAERPKSWVREGDFDDQLPAVIHLIFDEMMSQGAIDESLPGAAETREALYSLGEQYGLRTHDSVYSRSFFSGVAIPNLFNAEWRGKTGVADRFPELLESVPENAYFEDMARRGYRTAVFQTSLLNFCSNPRVELCETFASFDPGPVADSDLDLASRTVHVINILLRAYQPSYVSRYGQRVLSIVTPRARQPSILGTAGRFDVQRFPDWFARFIQFVGEVPRGAHVFGHFMVPHGPYVLSRDCAVADDGGVGYYLGTRVDQAQREQARREYYARYFAQVNCLRAQLARFFEAVEHNPNLRDATILIHGDHGSRISVGNVLEDYEAQDYLANYATFFAVRAPGVKPGIDCEFLSLPEAFRRYVTAMDGAPAFDRALPPVVVRTRLNEKPRVEAPMPRFGCALKKERDGS